MLRCGQWMGPRVDGKENVFMKDERLYVHGGEHKQIGLYLQHNCYILISSHLG